MNPPSPHPADVDATLALLNGQDYVADRRLATAVFLVLFVVFCVGFVWMVWRKRDKKTKE